jgi:hypothetical protein
MSPTAPRRASPTAATSAAGSRAWSATTSPTSSPRYGSGGTAVPQELTDYIAGRSGYDYNSHGKAGSPTDFVTDAVIDRFCIIGPAAHHVARLNELKALGVDQFALYLQHDAKAATLSAYGDRALPAANGKKDARI